MISLFRRKFDVEFNACTLKHGFVDILKTLDGWVQCIHQGPYLFAAFFKITYDSLQMVGPYILKDLLKFLSHCTTQDDEHESNECSLGAGMLFVVLILLSAGLQTSVLHQYFHRCFRTGMRLNASCISLVYCKSLKIASAGGVSWQGVSCR